MSGDKETGISIIQLIEKLDAGNSIVQKSFFIDSRDDENLLKVKTQKLERNAFPEAIIKIFRNI